MKKKNVQEVDGDDMSRASYYKKRELSASVVGPSMDTFKEIHSTIGALKPEDFDENDPLFTRDLPFPRKNYTVSDNCSVCFKKVSSKKHCKFCGFTCCGDCTKKKLPMPAAKPTSTRFRICDICCSKLYVRDIYAKFKGEFEAKAVTLDSFKSQVTMQEEQKKDMAERIAFKKNEIETKNKEFALRLGEMQSPKKISQQERDKLMKKVKTLEEDETKTTEMHKEVMKKKQELSDLMQQYAKEETTSREKIKNLRSDMKFIRKCIRENLAKLDQLAKKEEEERKKKEEEEKAKHGREVSKSPRKRVPKRGVQPIAEPEAYAKPPQPEAQEDPRLGYVPAPPPPEESNTNDISESLLNINEYSSKPREERPPGPDLPEKKCLCC